MSVLHPAAPLTCPGDTASYMMDVNLPFVSVFSVIINHEHKEKERKKVGEGESLRMW